MNESMVCGDVPASREHPADYPSLAESLDAEGVLALLAYEQSHGNRTAIVQALTERLAAVRSGTEPTGPLGDQLPPTLTP
ncbi:hypothetical protein [Mycetocola sp.]|jgi:hypothetical protein|uniref:hypothetical protein n=1 Tax=Mycetocola sp. TaxID=1871042 RepID=UPI0026277474|nr:hypothetical protein [Mycetocola sp.]MCU1560548.1 hypothetical protein [Mycetocola sp.]